MRIIAGDARGRKIETPTGNNTRPTLDRVRENLFNMIQTETAGRAVLDLFAGSGALSLEAVSRGAVSAVLVDNDYHASKVQLRNIESLGYSDRMKVLTCDWRTAVRQLCREQQSFGLVFLDPPYRMTELQEVFEELRPLVTRETLIILEHEAKKTVNVGDGFQCVRERSWGFCGISFFRICGDE